jgi:hypothetical protein
MGASMNSTAKPLPPFNYPSANTRLYSIAEGVTVMDLQDALDGKFALLDAMLCQTTGEQGEAFRRCNEAIQDSYLFGCATLVCEIHELYRQMVARI